MNLVLALDELHKARQFVATARSACSFSVGGRPIGASRTWQPWCYRVLEYLEEPAFAQTNRNESAKDACKEPSADGARTDPPAPLPRTLDLGDVLPRRALGSKDNNSSILTMAWAAA